MLDRDGAVATPSRPGPPPPPDPASTAATAMNEHFTTDSLIDYIHGELPPAEDALAHAHLQSCGRCRAEFDRESALREALRLAARQQELELPSMLKAQIWAAVREQRPPL